MTRVLHVLRRLEPGGIENWLLGLLNAWPAATRPEFHFALEEAEFGSLSSCFRALGARLHHCPPPRQFPHSARCLRHILQSHGPFDAVHCHTHYASPFALAVAARHGVSRRIAHSHADFRNRSASFLRRTYKRLSQSLLRIAANTRLAVSRAAAADLFGAAESVEILPCGFALEPYLNLNRTCDPGIFTLVQVGRLVPEKNHIHSLRLLKQLLRRGVSARLLVVGDGPLRPGLESACTCFGLTKNVEFLGAVPDPWRALSCADLALFPSHYEGLGLAALEAQAAGVPVLCAAHLPPEIDLIPGLLHRLALDLPIAEWAQKAMQLRFIPAPAKETRERQFLASPYSFSSNIRHLEQIYAA